MHTDENESDMLIKSLLKEKLKACRRRASLVQPTIWARGGECLGLALGGLWLDNRGIEPKSDQLFKKRKGRKKVRSCATSKVGERKKNDIENKTKRERERERERERVSEWGERKLGFWGFY